MSKNKGAPVRKSILRNVEIPVKKDESEKHVRIHMRPLSGAKSNGEAAFVEKHSSEKYTKPKTNSSAMFAKKIEDIKKGIGFNKKAEDCVDPATALYMKKRLTQQLNFPADQNVYHGLCPINVNDSVLEIDVAKRIRKRYSVPKQRLEKDPEPKLIDFLDPVEPFGGMKRGTRTSDKNVMHYARFVDKLPLKHQPPICTTLENVKMIFDLFS